MSGDGRGRWTASARGRGTDGAGGRKVARGWSEECFLHLRGHIHLKIASGYLLSTQICMSGGARDVAQSSAATSLT